MKSYPLFKVHVDVPSAMEHIRTVLESGYINEGAQVTQFQNEISQHLGNGSNLIVLNSCTSALTVALKLAGVHHGDHVVTTPMTCVATNTPIRNLGAKVVWADVDPTTGTLYAESIRRVITPKTKAVVFVAWAGNPGEMDVLYETCQQRGVKLILDAAHAFGAKYDNQCVSSFADYTCFPSTTSITTSEGKKKICDVEVGDLVLTSEGNYKPVIKTLARVYTGMWARIHVGQSRISATAEHPIKIHRSGKDSWIPVKDVVVGDEAYVKTTSCTKCNQLVPYYVKLCKECYTIVNRSSHKAEKISRSKKHNREVSRLNHHHNHVSPVMEKYRQDGYRVIPLIYAIPDFLALRNGKIIAVEVESGSRVRFSKLSKYEPLGTDTYDDVLWHTLKNVKFWAGRHKYEIVGQFARVPVWRAQTFMSKRKRTVYNLTLPENDPTYVAGGILVHNCYSFQAIKHITTGDGGALICKDPKDVERGKCLKWFGLDRDKSKDEKGDWKGQQWDVDIKEPGFKFNMNNISAAIGLSQMRHVQSIIDSHRKNADLYDTLFRSTRVHPLYRPRRSTSSNWVYTMLAPDSENGSIRDAIVKDLNSEGIMAGLVHVPNDVYTCFQRSQSDLPGIRKFARRHFSIPCGWWLSEEDVKHIASRVIQHHSR